MARYVTREDQIAQLVALRAQRDRSIEARRARAELEAGLADSIRRSGRIITDTGQEASLRRDGGVRIRQVNTEPRQPREPGRRSVRLAERLGFSGSREELRGVGRELRDAWRNLSHDEALALLSHHREKVQAALAGLDDDDDDIIGPDEPSPAKPTPTPTPKATSSDPTGWGADGVFRASRSQLRDPAWALQHQQDLVRAGAKLALVD
jgi:hypothetical protein